MIRETLRVVVRLIKQIDLHVLIDAECPLLYSVGLNGGQNC